MVRGRLPRYDSSWGAGRSVELIAGDIVAVAPEGPEQAVCSESLAERLRQLLGDQAYVREAHPITLAASEPEPDVAVVRGRREDYRRHHPGAADFFFVIEVADSTLGADLRVKRDLYAAAEIPEYWVLDLQHRQVKVSRQPVAGAYEACQTVTTGQVAPAAFPDCVIPLAELFG